MKKYIIVVVGLIILIVLYIVSRSGSSVQPLSSVNDIATNSGMVVSTSQPTTLFSVDNSLLKSHQYTSENINLDKHQYLYITALVDSNASFMLMLASEFEKAQNDHSYHPNVISYVETSPTVVPLDAGRYILVIVAGDKDVTYSLKLGLK